MNVIHVRIATIGLGPFSASVGARGNQLKSDFPTDVRGSKIGWVGRVDQRLTVFLQHLSTMYERYILANFRCLDVFFCRWRKRERIFHEISHRFAVVSLMHKEAVGLKERVMSDSH